MTLLDQFMKLVGPLAWPLATLIIALVFRRDVGQAMSRVGRVKYRDLELTFGEYLQHAEQMARSIPPADKGPIVFESASEGPELPVGRLISPVLARDAPPERPDQAGLGPRQVIQAAWSDVARASKVRRRMASASPSLVALVDLLRSLRDRAAQIDQTPPSPEHARRFAELARSVALRIEDLG